MGFARRPGQAPLARHRRLAWVIALILIFLIGACAYFLGSTSSMWSSRAVESAGWGFLKLEGPVRAHLLEQTFPNQLLTVLIIFGHGFAGRNR
jgi:hypothetical protein